MLFRSPTLLLLAALALFHAARAAVPAYELLAELERPGTQPLAHVTYVPTDGNYYGTTTSGGANNRGTIFRVTPDGTITTLVSFAGTSGAARGEAPDAGLLLRGADGALYGVTAAGGANDFGTVFKITTAGVLTSLVDFTGTGGTAKGSVPNGLVLNPADGNFYGSTQAGGTYDYGTVFRMTPAGAVTTLVDFTDTSSPRKGSTPVGALAVNAGILYGVTQTGGSSGFGTIFQYNLNLPANPWTLMAEFTGTSGIKRGSYAVDGLVLHPDGSLYGTTEFGGVNDLGTVFRITTSGIFSSLRQFADTDGAQPAGRLAVGPGNFLYGTTSAGGANGIGTIFKISTGGTYTLVAEFTGTGGAVPGDTPRAGLGPGANGELYGTTSAGGAGYGTVFKLSTSEAFASVANFTTPFGWQPGGAPVAVNADVFVPVKEGGANGGGALLRRMASGGVSVELPFGGTLGSEPAGALVQAGDYYGVTRLGGSMNRGTFFRYTPGAVATTLTNLNASGGARPEGPVILAPEGNFYGVASEGGSAGRGALLRFTPNGVRTTVVSFTGVGGAAPGDDPHAPLAYGIDGNLYGATESGGANGLGTVFQVTPAGVLTTLHTFAQNGPNTPLAGLSDGPDGNFYGTTGKGGAANAGTVFRITPTGVFTVLCEFTGNAGAQPGESPAGPLLVALDGTLYGMTDAGGATGDGTIFKITTAGAYVQLGALTNTSGAKPGKGAGALNFMPDGGLCGVTPNGGPRGGGTIFRFKQTGPHAATDPADVSGTSVTLRGRVQTGGEGTTVSFDYGTTAALGGSINLGGTVGPGGSPAPFNATLGGFTPGQTIFYRAKAANPSGTSTALTRSVMVPMSFAGWKLAQLGNANAPDLGDPDSDGVSCLVEYALLLKPNVADAGALPAPALKVYAEGPRLRLMVPRDPTRNDVTLEVRAGPTPAGPWTTIAASVQGAPFTGPGYVTGDGPGSAVKLVEIRDVVNVGDTTQRFLCICAIH